MSSTLQLPCPSILRGLGVFFWVTLFHNSLMNILQRIFNDYFEVIKYSMHPRPVEMENIEKMIQCGDPSFTCSRNTPPLCLYHSRRVKNLFLKRSLSFKLPVYCGQKRSSTYVSSDQQIRIIYSWFYLCASYLWQRFKVESTHSLPHLRRRLWQLKILA